MSELTPIDVSALEQSQALSDNDRILITKAANAHFGASVTIDEFKSLFLQPLVQASVPNNTMKGKILYAASEYAAIPEKDPLTLYVIVTEGEISAAYLGTLPFAVGGGSSGIPIDFVYLNLNELLLELGETQQLNATWEPQDATATTLSWSSSNKLVATVANGLVTSVGTGDCIISVKARSGAQADCQISVEITLINLSFSNSNKLVYGYDTQAEFDTTPEGATLSLTYATSNASQATVSNTGLITPVATSGNVTITATNKNGVSAQQTLSIVEFAVSVSSESIDPTDNSTSTIFSAWHVAVRGNATKYKWVEKMADTGAVLQSLDTWTAIPADGNIDIELYAEFGNKIVEWTFTNAAATLTENVQVPLLYKEPELVHYSFDINVTCDPADVAAITADVPYYKYDKKFTYNLRNDDNFCSLWRDFWRYFARKNMKKRWYKYPDVASTYDALTDATRRRSPRMLGYTDGCGDMIIFETDVAGQLQYVDVNNNLIFTPDSGVITSAQREDLMKHKDYGGHFLIHNMAFLSTDTVAQKYANDFTYPLQRDRQRIYDEFGYTSVTYANPDGDPYYTQPCIKDPKTILLSGGGFSFSRYSQLMSNAKYSAFGAETVKHYGLPDNRVAYSPTADLSNVTLYDIRNTLMTYYLFHGNHPYEGNNWMTQHIMAHAGQPTLATELTHGLSYDANWDDSYPSAEELAKLPLDLQFFHRIHDIAGANGDDTIWFCPVDESIEYMYYQRVAQITKTTTATGCKFNIAFDIPDYLGYKTYSLMLRNLPSNATVTRGTGVTSFNKNLATGLVNFGFSANATERAARYTQAYLNNPNNDTLQDAWYFVNKLGELKTTYASQLPVLNEVPNLTSATCASTSTSKSIVVTTVNANKEWGEADWLDVSESSNFTTYKSYMCPSDSHKWFLPLDDSCKSFDWTIELKELFGSVQNYYVRLRNRKGTSAAKPIACTLTRLAGTNDPVLSVAYDALYESTSIKVYLTYSYATEVRYKVNSGSFSAWQSISKALTITGSIGACSVVIEARNNLGDSVSQSFSTEVVASISWRAKLTTAYGWDYSYSQTVADMYIASTGFCKLPASNAYSSQPNKFCDTTGTLRGNVNKLPNHANLATYNFSLETTSYYRPIEVTGDNSAIYPDSMIAKSAIIYGNYDAKMANGKNGKFAYLFYNLPLGDYVIKIFPRHKSKFYFKPMTGYVRDFSDGVLTNYLQQKHVNSDEFYDNKDRTINLNFSITNSGQMREVGIACLYDLFGNDLHFREYAFSVLDLYAVQKYVPMTFSAISINWDTTATTSQTISVRALYTGSPSEIMLSENSNFAGASWVALATYNAFTLSSGYGAKTVYAKLRSGTTETEVRSAQINYVATPGIGQRIIFGNVINNNTAVNVAGLGTINSVQGNNTAEKTIRDINGNTFCTEVGRYYSYYGTQIDLFRTKYSISGEVSVSEAYWTIPTLVTESTVLPNALIVKGTDKYITMYGGQQTNNTYQTVHYFSGVPQGTYRIKILMSSGEGSTKPVPNNVRVQNTVQTITVASTMHNNNNNYLTFDNVVVGSDGMLLISNYPTNMLTVSYDNIVPIVVIDIVRLS